MSGSGPVSKWQEWTDTTVSERMSFLGLCILSFPAQHDLGSLWVLRHHPREPTVNCDGETETCSSPGCVRFGLIGRQLGKSEREKKILDKITYMWNLE